MLYEPVDSPHWSPYIIQREQTDLVSQEVRNYESEMYIDETVGGAMERVCAIPSIKKWRDTILKGTNVTQCKFETDGTWTVSYPNPLSVIHKP